MTLIQKLTLAASAAIFCMSIVLIMFEREEPVMDTSDQSIIGRWQKSVQSDCKTIYPSEIEFLKQGIYKAPHAVNEGAIWHGGDWQQMEGKQLSIQIANDAMLNYRISSQTPSSLILVDEAGCRIRYHKIY